MAAVINIFSEHQDLRTQKVYIAGMSEMLKANGGHYTVLIIEDEEIQRKVLAEKLSAAGFEILEATDGSRGLEKAVANMPDLILLDNRMPAMGGFEMLKRLREASSWGGEVPVIFFSNVEPQTKEEWGDIDATGALHYLVKSDTSLEELVKKVKEVLKIN